MLPDLVLNLLEVVEDGLCLETSSFGDHIDEVLLQGLVLLGEGFFHLFAVYLEKGNLDFLGKALP